MWQPSIYPAACGGPGLAVLTIKVRWHLFRVRPKLGVVYVDSINR